MTIQQESRFNMYQVVSDYLLPNSELTKELPEFAANFAAFQNAINEIHRISELQNFDKTGFAKEKKQLRDVGKPRLGLTEKSDATKQLAGFFKEADVLIGKMDVVINILMMNQPNFYNRYKEVRKVVVTGTGTLALKATAVELPGSTPLKGAKFTFMPDGGMMAGNIEIVKKTAEKGIFYLKSIPEGTYKVKVTKTGFKEKEVTISVVPGEMAEINVELEKV